MEAAMAIDTAWFHQQLEKRGSSVRGLARHLGLDASAVSRMLKGERKMSAEEQDRIAAFLGLSLEEVASHRRGGPAGFGESEQSPYSADVDQMGPHDASKEWYSEKDVIYRGRQALDGRSGWRTRRTASSLRLHEGQHYDHAGRRSDRADGI
jgi:transcriptional regulator with XRE-family HTH domain